MTDHEVGAEHLYGAVTQSSMEEKVQWHLTLSCSPENLGVEIEAPTEHIMTLIWLAIGFARAIGFSFAQKSSSQARSTKL